MDLRERVTIETPEHVEFAYEVAGLGSRFAAGCIDMLLQGSVVLAMFLVFWATGEAIAFSTYVSTALQGAMLLAIFLLIWGYHIYFETFRGGQSPGKRRLGIRVVAEGGQPCTLSRAAVRNLIRVVDFIPPPYGLAGLVMFVDTRGRRLGDLAAGTVVVRERGTEAPAAVAAARLPEAGEGERREDLDAEERRLLRLFLERRMELTPTARERLAARLAKRIAGPRGLVTGDDPEAFLEALHVHRVAPAAEVGA